MVQYSEQINTFEYALPPSSLLHPTNALLSAPLAYVALAHNLRFPSPYSSHVLSSDVISREFIGPSTLRTTRLILKRGKMPAWAPRALVKVGTSWVLEESEVDLEREGKEEVRTRSRNIDHKTVMEVWEWQCYRSKEGERNVTEVKTLTRVTSEFSFWPVRYRIEKFGISRVPKSSEKVSPPSPLPPLPLTNFPPLQARTGLSLILSVLLNPHTQPLLLSSGPLSPYPFPPLPSSLSLASASVRAKFDEARTNVLRREEEEIQRRLRRDTEDEGDSGEPGRIWRKRWRRAMKNVLERSRDRVCRVTGAFCRESEGEDGRGS